MSIEDDFRDLGFEMAKYIKIEIDKMKERTLSTIKFIEDETNKKITRDVEMLEISLIQNAEFKSNKEISERINKINKDLIFLKTEYVEKFLIALKEEISNRISKNPEKYFIFINSQIDKFTNLIQKPSKICFNARDLNFIQKNKNILNLSSNLSINSDNILETLSGFIIEADDQSFMIDFRLEKLIDKYKDTISMRFMEKFPVFEVNVENANQIYDKLHSKKIQ